MSLKVFHILFITCSVLLALGCAVWSVVNQVAAAFGILSAVAAVALCVYGVRFLKKSRDIIV